MSLSPITRETIIALLAARHLNDVPANFTEHTAYDAYVLKQMLENDSLSPASLSFGSTGHIPYVSMMAAICEYAELDDDDITFLIEKHQVGSRAEAIKAEVEYDWRMRYAPQYSMAEKAAYLHDTLVRRSAGLSRCQASNAGLPS